jgi:DNA repair and recombination protein RAD54B
MLDFVCPGLLGAPTSFRRVYEAPIVAGRDRAASSEAKRLGSERNAALAATCAAVLLRRGEEVNASFLPPRSDIVAFCPPSPLQHALYTALLKLPELRAAQAGANVAGSLSPLGALNVLRLLCSCPQALFSAAAEAEPEAEVAGSEREARSAVLAKLRPLYEQHLPQISAGPPGAAGGKLRALALLLSETQRLTPQDRTVVVAGWTTVLDAIAELCAALGLRCCRLDGSTPPDARVALVKAFNSGAVGTVFLLSTQAGGVG